MKKYYSEIQKSKASDDSKSWQVVLANASVEDVQAFQEKAMLWNEW